MAGDIWCLGPHRIACGDSTDPAAVAALLVSDKPQLMVTDPPYGVNYDPAWRHRVGVNKSISAPARSATTSAPTGRRPGRSSPATSPTSGTAPCMPRPWRRAWNAQGFAIRAQIIWAKERLVIGRGDYHWQHEPCWYAVRNKGNWTGDRKQTTLWTIPSGGQDAETSPQHPEAGRVHAPADAQQQRAGRCRLRAVPRQRHHPDRGGDRRAGSASPSRSIRSTSTSRCGAGRRSPARRRSLIAMAARSMPSRPSVAVGGNRRQMPTTRSKPNVSVRRRRGGLTCAAAGPSQHG